MPNTLFDFHNPTIVIHHVIHRQNPAMAFEVDGQIAFLHVAIYLYQVLELQMQISAETVPTDGDGGRPATGKGYGPCIAYPARSLVDFEQG